MHTSSLGGDEFGGGTPLHRPVSSGLFSRVTPFAHVAHSHGARAVCTLLVRGAPYVSKREASARFDEIGTKMPAIAGDALADSMINTLRANGFRRRVRSAIITQFSAQQERWCGLRRV